MTILVQFVLRLAFGLAAGMALTSPREVNSGFYRNQSYVLLGLCSLAAMASHYADGLSLWPPIAAAVLCYVCAVTWLYEKSAAGRVLLVIIAALTLSGAFLASGPVTSALLWLDPLVGGLVLGVTMAAMLLGHWYLNSPTMKIGPLMRLVNVMTVLLVARALLSGVALGMWLSGDVGPEEADLLFVLLRWLAGIVGPLALTWMARKTLEIPNTQSATGILYVAVIGTFVGELTGQLLSLEAGFPL